MLPFAVLFAILLRFSVDGFFYEVNEGDPCYYDGGKLGTCITFYKCDATYQNFLNGGQYGPEKYCFYNGVKLLVCCPTDASNNDNVPCGSPVDDDDSDEDSQSAETPDNQDNPNPAYDQDSNPSNPLSGYDYPRPPNEGASAIPTSTDPAATKPSSLHKQGEKKDDKWGPGFVVLNQTTLTTTITPPPSTEKPVVTVSQMTQANSMSNGNNNDTQTTTEFSFDQLIKELEMEEATAKPISFKPIGEADAALQNKASLAIYLRKCYEFGAGRCKSKTQLGKEGYVEIAVVGGSKAEAAEFPFMVAVGFDGREKGTLWLCGGSLISDRFVLTAAHCTSSSAYGNAIRTRAGDLNIKRSDDDAKPQDRQIVERIRHPLYKRPSEYHDIAVLRVDSPFAFDKYVYPACLSNRADNDEYYNEITAIGWGREDWANDEGSADLLKVVINLVDPEECNKTFIGETTDDRLPSGIVERWQVCAGSVGKDTCQGDSGGPLLTGFREFKCMPEVLGVTSIGRLCGSGVPGIYTRTYNYLPWIESVVWPDG